MVTRQLSAIIFADIQGYTALMLEDEWNARMTRDKFQKVLENECKTHNGRIAGASGDGALCIFISAIEAVHAAICIQREMIAEPKVPLRIGIHSGDILFDGDNIYESLALIYILLDEQDKAIDILQQLLTMPFAWTMSNSVPLYKMFYYWKPLQNNARFQQMFQ